jgi:thioredoxin reductase (NADPH)
VIVGAGPAGLAAAVYGASEGLRTIVDRARGARRPGRHLVSDRELLGFPSGCLRRRAREPGAAAGRAARPPRSSVTRLDHHAIDAAHAPRLHLAAADVAPAQADHTSPAASRGGGSRSTALRPRLAGKGISYGAWQRGRESCTDSGTST